MGNPKVFIETLQHFDKDNCKLDKAKKARKILGDVTVPSAKKVSFAASNLAEWVINLTNYVFERNDYQVPEESKEEQRQASPERTSYAQENPKKKKSPLKKGKKKIASPAKEEYSPEEAIREKEDSTTPLPREDIP